MSALTDKLNAGGAEWRLGVSPIWVSSTLLNGFFFVPCLNSLLITDLNEGGEEEGDGEGEGEGEGEEGSKPSFKGEPIRLYLRIIATISRDAIPDAPIFHVGFAIYSKMVHSTINRMSETIF